MSTVDELDAIQTARWAAKQCARAANDAAGDKPWDNEGFSLLPDEPQEGDWEALQDELGREPTNEERKAFEREYAAVMKTCRGTRFGERLKRYRREHDLTQKELADQLRVDSNTEARWERGDMTPQRHTEAGIINRLK